MCYNKIYRVKIEGRSRGSNLVSSNFTYPLGTPKDCEAYIRESIASHESIGWIATSGCSACHKNGDTVEYYIEEGTVSIDWQVYRGL